MVRLPESFPEGTEFLKVADRFPVTLSPDGFKALCWMFFSGVGKEPPWGYSLTTARDDGVEISEAEFRKLVAARAAERA